MKTIAVNELCEIVSDPTTLGPKDQIVVQDADLPEVESELSVTLRLKIKSHASDWASVFFKGTQWSIRTPGLWLTKNKSKLHARFSGNWADSAGIEEAGDGLLLNKWYHLTYTLSDIEKRLDVYIDGEWVEFFSIPKVQTQKVVFNDGPLYIGRNHSFDGFEGEISNFHYFNWRLSANEVMKDYLNNNLLHLAGLGKCVPYYFRAI